jgi:hypothetical protein
MGESDVGLTPRRLLIVRGERGGGKACTFGSSRMQALSLKGEITIAG